jgi:DNA-binding transcriptional LysR family regulator
MDRLKQIESFVAVSVKGSLTAAAAAEGVAPAVIGRRIDALEERLGVKLLVRTTRRISLTHEGSAFLEDAQRLLADLANAEASVSAGGLQASGHLRITAPAGFGRRHVAPLVPQFVALHPDVSLSLNLSDRLVDLVNEGFDCAVRVGDMPDSSLVSVRLADNRRLCVASPAYLAARGRPLHPSDIARQLRGQPDARLGFHPGWPTRLCAPRYPPGLLGRPGAARLVPGRAGPGLALMVGGGG